MFNRADMDPPMNYGFDRDFIKDLKVTKIDQSLGNYDNDGFIGVIIR